MNKYYSSYLIEDQKVFIFYIKLCCLIFWTTWFSLVSLTNFFDLLINLSVVREKWRFASGNYRAIIHVINIYPGMRPLAKFLFVFDIIIQTTSALLFACAAITFWRGSKHAWSFINIAFGASISLWVCFLIVDELFIAYPYEATHMRLIIFEMLSLLLIHLLPHRPRSVPS